MTNLKGNILVIGDIMLDHYIFGSVDRISPEAPVPVVSVKKEAEMLGGCGNVVQNLNNLGIKVGIISVIGQDKQGDKILEILNELNIDVDSIFRSKTIQTNYKMRVVASNQHVVRADWDSSTLNENSLKIIENDFLSQIKNYDGVLISDYAKGVCDQNFLNTVILEANKYKLPVFVDPKGSDWRKYSGANYITPNAKEGSEVIGINLKTNDDFVKAGKEIIKNFAIKNCLLTRGADGMTLVNRNNFFHIKSDAREVYDVSGAGDTVISCLAASIISGYSIEDAVKFSNFAAGIVVSHIGTSAIKIDEIKEYQK